MAFALHGQYSSLSDRKFLCFVTCIGFVVAAPVFSQQTDKEQEPPARKCSLSNIPEGAPVKAKLTDQSTINGRYLGKEGKSIKLRSRLANESNAMAQPLFWWWLPVWLVALLPGAIK